MAVGNKVSAVQVKQDVTLAALSRLDAHQCSTGEAVHAIGESVRAGPEATAAVVEEKMMSQLASFQRNFLRSLPRNLVPDEALRPEWLARGGVDKASSPPPSLIASASGSSAAPPVSPPASVPPRIPSLPLTTSTLPDACPPGCPIEGATGHIGTARETWQEFFVGLWKDGAQAPSLRELDLRWGARWR